MFMSQLEGRNGRGREFRWHIRLAMSPACKSASSFKDDTFFKGTISVAGIVGR